MTSPFSERNAAALAERILKNGGANDESRIAYAFKVMFSRETLPSEISKNKKFIANATTESAGKPLTVKDSWTQVTFGVVE